MSIKVNTKETETVVYDKANLIYALPHEVVPLISSIRGDIRDTLVDIISDSLGLNDSERELYKAITAAVNVNILDEINKEPIVDLNYISNTIAIFNNKAYITYKRAIDTLIVKGVIRYAENRRYAKINKAYNVSAMAEVAKYIVIEIKPKDVQRQATL